MRIQRSPRVALQFDAVSDVGCVRTVNEDNHAFFSQGARKLFVVADGMGGEAGGRVASQTAVKAVRESFEQGDRLVPAALLQECVERANEACLRGQQESPELASMGTTLELLLCEGSSVWWAHVGDSRIYRIRRGRATQLTRDHTRVQQMVDDGLLTPKQAADHPQRNILSRVVGRADEATPDVSAEPIRCDSRDVFLMCSDGLTDVVSDAELEWHVARADPPEACRALIRLARRRGAPDNVTVLAMSMRRPAGALARTWRRWRSPISPAGRRRIRRVASRTAWVVVLLAGLAAGTWLAAKMWRALQPVPPTVEAPVPVVTPPVPVPGSPQPGDGAPLGPEPKVVPPPDVPAPPTAKPPSGRGGGND